MTLGALTEQTCYNNRLQAQAMRLGSAATTACANSGNDGLNLTFNYGGTNNNGNLLARRLRGRRRRGCRATAGTTGRTG